MDHTNQSISIHNNKGFDEDSDEDDLEQNDVDDEIDSDVKATLLAAEQGDIIKLKQLICKKPELVHSKDRDKYTPLHRASYNNHAVCARYLLDMGADISARTEDDWEPIHSAAKWCNLDVLEFLIQRGANINSQSSGGNTPLHLAASNGRKRETCKVVQLLLFNPKCRHELPNHSGDTAFDLARRAGPFYKFWSGVRTIFDSEYPQ